MVDPVELEVVSLEGEGHRGLHGMDEDKGRRSNPLQGTDEHINDEIVLGSAPGSSLAQPFASR